MLLKLPIRIGALSRMGVLIRIGVLIGMGALIDKNTFEGGALIRKALLIGRRALNQTITGP